MENTTTRKDVLFANIQEHVIMESSNYCFIMFRTNLGSEELENM